MHWTSFRKLYSLETRRGAFAFRAVTKTNLDSKTVEGFGVEWTRFDQSQLSEREFTDLFERYFGILNFDELPFC